MAIPVALLREVLESDSAAWTEGGHRLGGLVDWQGRSVPVQLLSRLPGWEEIPECSGRHLLVVEENRTLHGLLVDDIVGIFPAEGFILHDVPEALRGPALLYGHLAVLDGQVMIVCGQRFFAGLTAARGAA
ncbi:MAG: hypothetical protein Tsb0017_02710 [Geothermobacteraceae bacterium]